MAMTKQEKLDKKAEALYEKKHKKRYRKSNGDWTFDILNHAFFAIFTLACIFPFYYIFINIDIFFFYCIPKGKIYTFLIF